MLMAVGLLISGSMWADTPYWYSYLSEETESSGTIYGQQSQTWEQDIWFAFDGFTSTVVEYPNPPIFDPDNVCNDSHQQDLWSLSHVVKMMKDGFLKWSGVSTAVDEGSKGSQSFILKMDNHTLTIDEDGMFDIRGVMPNLYCPPFFADDYKASNFTISGGTTKGVIDCKNSVVPFQLGICSELTLENVEIKTVNDIVAISSTGGAYEKTSRNGYIPNKILTKGTVNISKISIDGCGYSSTTSNTNYIPVVENSGNLTTTINTKGRKSAVLPELPVLEVKNNANATMNLSIVMNYTKETYGYGTINITNEGTIVIEGGEILGGISYSGNGTIQMKAGTICEAAYEALVATEKFSLYPGTTEASHTGGKYVFEAGSAVPVANIIKDDVITGCSSLENAFGGATAGSTIQFVGEGSSLTMSQDATLASGVTLDLNGGTLDCGDYRLSMGEGSNTSIIKNGSITGSNNNGLIAIENNCAIDFQNITFSNAAKQYAIESHQSNATNVSISIDANTTFANSDYALFMNTTHTTVTNYSTIGISSSGTITWSDNATINNYGTLNYGVNTTATNGGSNMTFNNHAGTMNILKGTYSGCTFTVDGGTMNVGSKDLTVKNTVTFSRTSGTLNIVDGNFVGADVSGVVSVVKGGSFKKNDATYSWLNTYKQSDLDVVATIVNSKEAYVVASSSAFVAEWNGMKFIYLDDAIKKAQAGDEVNLIGNTTESVTISKNITLNLVSGTLTGNVTIAADVTINGTLQEGVYQGTINGGNGSAIKFSGSRTLTINGGNFTAEGTKPVIDMNSTTNTDVYALIVNNGNFVGSSNVSKDGSIISTTSAGYNRANITINRGEFSMMAGKPTTNKLALICFAPINSNGSTLTIKEGNFTIDYSVKNTGNYNWACVAASGQYNTMNITGGSFENKTTADKYSSSNVGYGNALLVYDAFGSVSLANAKFKSYGKAGWIWANQMALKEFDVDNVTFISEAQRALDLGTWKDNQTMTIAGGYFEGDFGIFIGGSATATGKISITDCNIDAKTTGIGVTSTQYTIAITGGTIISGKKGVNVGCETMMTIGGSASIKGGTYGVYNDKGSINITGGRIWGETNSVFNTKYLECAGLQGIVEVTGGVFNNRPVPEGYIVRGGTPASAPKRAASGLIAGGGDGTPPGGGNKPEPCPSDDPQEGNATILGVGLDVITNTDKTTYDLGYLYTVGRLTGANISVNPDAEDSGLGLDWSENDTWTNGTENMIPTISDDVVIEGRTVVVGKDGKTTDAVANQVTVKGGDDGNQGDLIVKTGSSLTVGEILSVEKGNNDALGKVTVEAGGKLSVGEANDLTNLDIVLQDDGVNGTGVMLFNPANPTQKEVFATIELRTNAHKNNDGTYFWNYIGIPLKLNAGEFKAENWEKVPVTAGQPTGTYLQSWDFTQGWVNQTIAAFAPFQGMSIANNSEDGVIYRFKGTMVGNADKKMEFKPRGYNFFANSYTAPIDIQTLLEEQEAELGDAVNATVYMFDTKNGRFEGVAKGAFEGFHAPYFRVIPSMNGFFILNNNTTPAENTMDYEDAVYNCALGNRPIFAPKHEAMNFSRVHINVEADGSKDGLYLIENDEFTSEFENGYDVVKYMTKGQYNIYAQTTTGRQSELFNSNIEGTMIGFEAAADQTMYTMSFDEVQGDNFVLTDMVTGESVEMSEGNTYTFFAEAGQSNDNRFLVTRANKVPTTIGGLKSNAKAQGIYSVTGHYFGNVTEWNRLPQGVYMVNGVKVIK